MSFGKKLIGTFFEVEEEKKPEVNVQGPLAPQTANYGGGFKIVSPLASSTSLITPIVAPGLSEEDKKKISDKIKDLYLSVNDPKPSYHEVINMVTIMGEQVPINVRFLAAYNAFTSQGLTKQVLLATAQQTMNTISKDREEFLNTVNNKLTVEMDNKRKAIEAKQKQILALQDQIVALNNEIGSLDQDIKSSEGILKVKAEYYQSVSTQYENKIKDDITLINQYIQ